MRLKTFHGKTMRDVMEDIRKTLGPDAIIIATDETPTSVRVTAALEADATPPPPSEAPSVRETPPTAEMAIPPVLTREFDQADVTAVLRHHGIPGETASRLNTAIDSIAAASLVDAFAAALDTTIKFSPLTNVTTRPIMLVGPGGVGKTICSAKLVAGAVLHRRSVKLITSDTVKAGGVAQLDHFAQIMKQTVLTADNPGELQSVLSTGTPADVTIIDTYGINPFDMTDLGQLLKFIRAVDAEPIAVMPAGLDPYDAREIAEIFGKLGCQRFIATRLDVARRYAGIVTAARPGSLALAAISRSPYVAEGLEPASPTAFARLLTTLPNTRSDKLVADVG